MKTLRFARLFSAVCAAAMLVAAMQAVAFAADDNTVDLGTVRPGDEYESEKISRNGAVSVRIPGNPPVNETRIRTSSNPAKPYADVIYDFDELPQEWVIPIRSGSTVVGYFVVLPAKNKTNFRLSGTEFKTVQIMEESTYGDPIKLTDGKYQMIYNEHAIKVMLRD